MAESRDVVALGGL